MQASSVQAGVSGLLSLLLSGGLGETVGLDSADSPGFVETMAAQIKDLLVKSGEDPAEIAALDDQGLVAQLLALWQGQPQPVTGDGALLGAGSSSSGTTGVSSVLMGMLSNSTSLDAVDGLETAQADLSAVESESSGQTSSFQMLPSSFLQQLLDSTDPEVLKQSLTAVASTQAEANVSESLLATMSQGFSASSLAVGQVGSGLAAGQMATGEAGLSQIAISISGNLLSQVEDGMDRLESTEGTDASAAQDALSRSGATMPGSAVSDAQSVKVSSNQTLDLSKLLQPGGETPLADQVKWILHGATGTAEMKLHPASLGALDVRVTMESNEAHVQFISSHPIVREVLEAALPRLREALAQEGVSLGNVTVSDHAGQGRSDAEQGQAPWTASGWQTDLEAGDGAEASEPLSSTVSALSRRHDYFV